MSTSYFSNRGAVNTLLGSWVSASGLYFMGEHLNISAWFVCAFLIAHVTLVVLLRERISGSRVTGEMPRDFLIVVSAPLLGSLVWYYRWKHNITTAEQFSNRWFLRIFAAVVVLIGLVPLFVWVLGKLFNQGK